MGKKVKITEEQLKLIVNYIKENEKKPVHYINESELLEEGRLSRWAITGLMALSALAGKAQTSDKADSQDELKDIINKAKKVQVMLADKDSQEYNVLKDAAKQLNIQNLEDLEDAVTNDEDLAIKVLGTNNLKQAEREVEKGGVVTGIKITTDTTWKEIPQPLYVQSDLEANLNGDLFVSGGWDLNPDVIEELDFSLKSIRTNNGTLQNVTIHSSTDKEPIDEDGPTARKLKAAGYTPDNEGLSKARKDAIYKYIVQEQGVDKSLITLDVKWEQGPDVYSSDMTDAEREAARDLPGTTEARNVGATYTATYEMTGEETEKVYTTINRYFIEITQTETPLKGGYVSTVSGNKKIKKMELKKRKFKCGSDECILWGKKY